MNPDLTNHRNPSPDRAAALDRAPACQCKPCLYRRSKPERDHLERMIREARERERAGAA